MLEKIESNCPNCGAPLRRGASRCEYCRTEYKRNNDGIPIGFAKGVPGTQTIYATLNMDSGFLLRNPEEAKRDAEDKLAHAVAKELLKYCQFATTDDYRTFNKIVRVAVTVVDPRQHEEDVQKEQLDEVSDEFRRVYMRSMLVR